MRRFRSSTHEGGAGTRALTPTRQQVEQQRQAAARAATDRQQQQREPDTPAASSSVTMHSSAQPTLTYSAALFKSLESPAIVPPAAAAVSAWGSGLPASSAAAAAAAAGVPPSPSRPRSPVSLSRHSHSYSSSILTHASEYTSMSMDAGSALDTEAESSVASYPSRAHSPSLLLHEANSQRSTPRAHSLSRDVSPNTPNFNSISPAASREGAHTFAHVPSATTAAATPHASALSTPHPQSIHSTPNSTSSARRTLGMPIIASHSPSSTASRTPLAAPAPAPALSMPDPADFPALGGAPASSHIKGAWSKAPPLLKDKISTGTPLSRTPSARTPTAGTPVLAPATPAAHTHIPAIEEKLPAESALVAAALTHTAAPAHTPAVFTVPAPRPILSLAPRQTDADTNRSASSLSGGSGASGSGSGNKSPTLVGPPSTASMPTGSDGCSKADSLLSGSSTHVESSSGDSRSGKRRTRKRRPGKSGVHTKLTLDQLVSDEYSASVSASVTGDAASISSSSLSRTRSPVGDREHPSRGAASESGYLSGMSITPVQTTPSTPVMGAVNIDRTNGRQQRLKSERGSRAQALRSAHSMSSSGAASPLQMHSQQGIGIAKSASARSFAHMHIGSAHSYRNERGNRVSLAATHATSSPTPFYPVPQQMPFYPSQSASHSLPPMSLSLPLVHAPPPRLELIKLQLEYYFSPDNLAKDVYLRSLMNARGYVPIARLLEFNRLKLLTNRAVDVLTAVTASRFLKLKNGAVRSRNEWRKYVTGAGGDGAEDITDAESEEVRNENLGMMGTSHAQANGSAHSPVPSLLSSSSDGSNSEAIALQIQHQQHATSTLPMGTSPATYAVPMPIGQYVGAPAAGMYAAAPFFPYFPTAPPGAAFAYPPHLIPVYAGAPTYSYPAGYAHTPSMQQPHQQQHHQSYQPGAKQQRKSQRAPPRGKGDTAPVAPAPIAAEASGVPSTVQHSKRPSLSHYHSAPAAVPPVAAAPVDVAPSATQQ